MNKLILPSKIIKIIINLFERRKARVITALGSTDPYEAGNGID